MSEKLYKCECCNREFGEKEYLLTNQKNKCILHCEKDNWYEVDEKGCKDWSNSENKINRFWSLLQQVYINIVNQSNKIVFDKIVFPKHQKDYEYYSEIDENGFLKKDNLEDMGTNFYDYSYPEKNLILFFEEKIVEFKNCKFLDQLSLAKYNLKNTIEFFNCSFNGLLIPKGLVNSGFYFNKCIFNNTILDFTKRTFTKHLIIKNSIDKISKINLEYSIIERVFSLYNSKIEDYNFRNTTFNSEAIFEEAKFYTNLNFKYTNFMKNTFFNELEVIGKLDLKTCVLNKKTTFLGIKSNIENRETARIIKDSFEQQNNVIEANKFYALEMKEREKELQKDLKNGKNILEWLVFKIHGITSNHSQNWEYSLFWIIIISLFYSYSFDFLPKESDYINILHMNYQESLFCAFQSNKEIYGFFKLSMWMTSPFIVVYFISNYSEKLLYFFLCISLIVLYIYLTKDFTLSIVANNINPFSIITEKGKLGLAELLYRVSIAFLIYQLIISIRQNTRRK